MQEDLKSARLRWKKLKINTLNNNLHAKICFLAPQFVQVKRETLVTRENLFKLFATLCIVPSHDKRFYSLIQQIITEHSVIIVPVTGWDKGMKENL